MSLVLLRCLSRAGGATTYITDKDNFFMYDNKSINTSKGSVCIAVAGSMTYAMKAQNALAAASIRSNVTKINSSKSKKGCAYGVSFQCCQLNNVKTVLRNAGIRIHNYIEE